MKIKMVPSTWLEIEEYRLNAKPYFSGAIEAKLALEKFSCELLINLVVDGKKGIFNGPRFGRVHVDDPVHGLPLLSGSDMLQADLSYTDKIAKWKARSMPEMILKEGTTLISSYGTVGRCIFTRKEMVGMVGSDNILKVIPDKTKIFPGYLYAFLSSKFGIPLITKGEGGSVVTYLDPSRVHSLPIPRIGDVEDQAHQLIQHAANLRTEAAAQIRVATARFLTAAHLEDIPAYEWIRNSGKIGFAASIKKNLLRAVNYIPLNFELTQRIKRESPNWKPLGELTQPGTLRRGLRFKRIDADPEFGVELVGQREGFNLVPKGRWVAKSFLPNDKLIYVPAGTIVIAAQGGLNEGDSFARSQFILGKMLRYVYSEHFLRVIGIDKLIPRGALFAYLRSNIAFRLLRSCSIGSMQQDFHPELLCEIPVPIISKDENFAVDRMVREAYHNYDDAIDCEENARALVERTIEEGNC